MQGQLDLVIKGTMIDSKRAQDLTQLRRVRLANSLFRGDEEFLRAEFGEQTWLVPEFTPGFDDFLRECLKVCSIKDTTIETIPWALRQRFLGLIPLFPIPRLCVVETKSLKL